MAVSIAPPGKQLLRQLLNDEQGPTSLCLPLNMNPALQVMQGAELDRTGERPLMLLLNQAVTNTQTGQGTKHMQDVNKVLSNSVGDSVLAPCPTSLLPQLLKGVI